MRVSETKKNSFLKLGGKIYSKCTIPLLDISSTVHKAAINKGLRSDTGLPVVMLPARHYKKGERKLNQAFNYTQATETMAFSAPHLGLGAPSKFPIDFKIF